RIWDAATGAPAAPPLEHHAPVWCVRFSPDGQRLVTGSDGQTAHVWDAASGRLLAQISAPGGPAKDAAFSPDGSRIVSAHTSEARISDAASGRALVPPLKHNSVEHVAFSPDGARVLTAGLDQVVRIWDAASGQPAASALR